MKKKQAILFLAVMFLMPFVLYAQKDLTETQSQITYETPSNGPQGGVIQNSPVRPEIDALLAELRTARKSGDVSNAARLQNQLDIMTGAVKSNGSLNGPQPVSEMLNEPVEGNPLDYGFTVINSTDGVWASATSTDRVTGRIYAAVTKYYSSGSDTIKLYTSANNGVSWTLFQRISFASTGVHFRNDELDIEAINNGSTSYIYLVGGLNFNSIGYSFVTRVNSTGGEFFFSYLYTSSATVNHIYPRIASDASNYTGAAYIYIILTQDSTTGATSHLKTKLVRITNPYVAPPTLTYGSQTGTAGSYWWNASGVADSTVLYNDIGYSDSLNADVVITVSNFYRFGFNNLYLTYTKNYGATAPYWTPQITEANVNYKPRIAFTGLDSTYGMICYTRRFNATDWDPYYRRTTNNGVSWTAGYVDASTDTTFYTDVVAIPRVQNTFRIAYAVNTSPTSAKFLTRSFNKGVFLSSFQLNPISTSYSFTPGRAGYRYSATDSCFNIMSTGNGAGLYAFTGCSGAITNAGNNNIPVRFDLSQNYPNP
ncbi:MAG: hypothetical protein MUE56_06970, partial [Ignavibacteria bacterium]|nr:hypothetical protein [Ignavibacteria bacterium]